MSHSDSRPSEAMSCPKKGSRKRVTVVPPTGWHFSPPLPTVSSGYTNETSSDLVSVLLMVGEIALSKMDLHSCWLVKPKVLASQQVFWSRRYRCHYAKKNTYEASQFKISGSLCEWRRLWQPTYISPWMTAFLPWPVSAHPPTEISRFLVTISPPFKVWSVRMSLWVYSTILWQSLPWKICITFLE